MLIKKGAGVGSTGGPVKNPYDKLLNQPAPAVNSKSLKATRSKKPPKATKATEATQATEANKLRDPRSHQKPQKPQKPTSHRSHTREILLQGKLPQAEQQKKTKKNPQKIALSSFAFSSRQIELNSTVQTSAALDPAFFAACLGESRSS